MRGERGSDEEYANIYFFFFLRSFALAVRRAASRRSLIEGLKSGGPKTIGFVNRKKIQPSKMEQTAN